MINNEFYDILQKGLGRAFNYVSTHKKEELRPDLLDACLHNLVYDSQSEKSRSDWLFKLISLTDDVEFYRQEIVNALPNTVEFWDKEQLYNLVAIWAKQGCKEAKQIIYDSFRKQEFDESWLGGAAIIEIDGICGLLYVADIVGRRLIKDEELWEDDYLISIAGESFGVEKVMKALEQESKNNSNIKYYLNTVKKHKYNIENNNKARRSKRQIWDIDTVLQQIEKPKTHIYGFVKFGRYAQPEDIERAFDNLLKETRREQLIRYLWIFKDRQFPKLDNKLFDFATANDKELQTAAIRGLANHQDKSIHDLAIHLIRKNINLIDIRVFKLLINNYITGNYKLIEPFLLISQDIHFRHDIGMDLIKIIDTQKTSELQNCALWVYENTPCAYCRQKIVEILIDLKLAPKSLLEECLNDCSSDIRELASKNNLVK